jgi:hypothetical protein
MKKKEAMNLLRPKSRKKLQGKLKAAVKQARRTGEPVHMKMRGTKKR